MAAFVPETQGLADAGSLADAGKSLADDSYFVEAGVSPGRAWLACKAKACVGRQTMTSVTETAGPERVDVPVRGRLVLLRVGG